MGQMARSPAHMLSAVIAATISLTAAPAFAQTVSGVTVVAPPVNKYESTFSYRVSYADLDLRKADARKEFDRRISITANYVCNVLKEPNVSECAHQAVMKAAPAVARAKHIGMTKTIKFTPGEPWIPPPGVQ